MGSIERPEEPLDWNQREWLASCVREGLLLPAGQGQHKWVHDKFREAALSLIVPEKLQSFRFRVGEIFLSQLDGYELSRSIFTVADLLNAEPKKAIKNKTTLLKMTEINLQAAKAAMASASFSQAVEYLKMGFLRMPPDAWYKHYELALEMHSSAAEAYYCIGDSEKVELHCHAVIQQDECPLTDKFRVYNVLIDSTGNRNLMERAIKICVLLLEELNCNLPKKNFFFHTIKGIGRVKLTKAVDTNKLMQMTDASEKQAMRVLDKLATFTYIAGHPLLPLAIFKSHRWSLNRGLSEFSPPAFGTVGLILCSKLNVSFCTDS